MSDPFSSVSQSGGTLAGGPSDVGITSGLATGDWNAGSHIMNIDGSTRIASKSKDGRFNLTTAEMAAGSTTAAGNQIWGNWKFLHPRTMKALPYGLQNQSTLYMPLFLKRYFPESRKDQRKVGSNVMNQFGLVGHRFKDVAPFLGLDHRRTVILEEVFTLAGINFSLFKRQELLYRLAREKTGPQRRDAERAQEEMEMTILRTIAFCGTGVAESKLGLRETDRPGPAPSAAAQKRIMTITEGYANLHNVWGSTFVDHTPLFFILKRLEDDEIPVSYNYLQDSVEVPRDNVTGKLLMYGTEDPDAAPRFRPWQFIPFARSGADTPSMEDRSYLRPDGTEGHGHYISVGQFKWNTQPGLNVSAYAPRYMAEHFGGEQQRYLPFSTTATILAPQIVVNIDIDNPIQPIDLPAVMQHQGPPQDGPNWQAHHLF